MTGDSLQETLRRTLVCTAQQVIALASEDLAVTQANLS
jgi:hypothetical protein